MEDISKAISPGESSEQSIRFRTRRLMQTFGGLSLIDTGLNVGVELSGKTAISFSRSIMGAYDLVLTAGGMAATWMDRKKHELLASATRTSIALGHIGVAAAGAQSAILRTENGIDGSPLGVAATFVAAGVSVGAMVRETQEHRKLQALGGFQHRDANHQFAHNLIRSKAVEAWVTLCGVGMQAVTHESAWASGSTVVTAVGVSALMLNQIARGEMNVWRHKEPEPTHKQAASAPEAE